MTRRPVRVATIEPDPVLRVVLGHAFSRRADAELVAEADGSSVSLDRLVERRPDVVLLDQRASGRRGLDLLGTLAARLPTAMRAVLTSSEDLAARRAAFDAGAHALYAKGDLSLALIERILTDHARFTAARSRGDLGIPPGR